MYQPVVTARQGALSACALTGINSAIIAWNIDDSFDRRTLMGFAVKRTDFHPVYGDIERMDWLSGQKRFRYTKSDFGVHVRSDQGPFQRFRWSDYSLRPHTHYRYSIYPMVGKPGKLERAGLVELDIYPTDYQGSDFSVYTNRGVTAAQAFLERFRDKHPLAPENHEIRVWLSRGLKESLLAFIDQARRGDALQVAIYEFHDHDVAAALRKARERGVAVQIVCDAVRPDSKVVKENLHLLDTYDLRQVAVLRRYVNISHNKFVVWLRDGAARAVWTGTSNFTNNAFFLQTNSAVIIHEPGLADRYAAYFQVLVQNNTKAQSKKDNEALLASLPDTGVKSFFSPVKPQHIVEAASELVRGAQSAVFVSSPFGLDRQIMDALAANGDHIVEYGLANATAQRKIAELNRRNTRFYVPTRLETYMGREWDAKAFGAHKIHTKVMVVDPWGEDPKVLFGSANFSKPSCNDNDENAFLVTGNPRLAAIFSTEFVRMWDHYKSRHFITKVFKSSGNTKEAYLTPDASWLNTAFNPASRSHKYRDRVVFSGST